MELECGVSQFHSLSSDGMVLGCGGMMSWDFFYPRPDESLRTQREHSCIGQAVINVMSFDREIVDGHWAWVSVVMTNSTNIINTSTWYVIYISRQEVCLWWLWYLSGDVTYYCLPGSTCLTCWTNCQRGSGRLRWHASRRLSRSVFLVQFLQSPKSRQPHLSYLFSRLAGRQQEIAFTLIFRWLMCILRRLDHAQVGNRTQYSKTSGLCYIVRNPMISASSLEAIYEICMKYASKVIASAEVKGLCRGPWWNNSVGSPGVFETAALRWW